MHFDKRYGHCGQGIAHGNTRMRKGPCVNDDEIDAFACRSVDAVDQRAFVVALERGESKFLPARMLLKLALDISQALRPVKLRLARAQPI